MGQPHGRKSARYAIHNLCGTSMGTSRQRLPALENQCHTNILHIAADLQRPLPNLPEKEQYVEPPSSGAAGKKCNSHPLHENHHHENHQERSKAKSDRKLTNSGRLKSSGCPLRVRVIQAVSASKEQRFNPPRDQRHQPVVLRLENVKQPIFPTKAEERSVV